MVRFSKSPFSMPRGDLRTIGFGVALSQAVQTGRLISGEIDKDEYLHQSRRNGLQATVTAACTCLGTVIAPGIGTKVGFMAGSVVAQVCVQRCFPQNEG